MCKKVIVIGLGATGSYAAWKLAQQGVHVIGLEQHELLHTKGAYSGESRLFRAAYHEGAEYVPLLLESRTEWLELQELGGREIFRPTGALSIGSATAPQMVQVQQSLQHADVAHEVLSSEELRTRFPQHTQITDEIGVLDLMGGVLRPESAVAEIQRQAIIHGADLRGHQNVRSVKEEGDHVSVTLADGTTLKASEVIITSGVHTPQLLPELAPYLVIMPISLTWFCPDDPTAFTPEVFPAFIRDLGSIHIFGVPMLDGSLVKAGYDAKLGTIDTPAQLPTTLTAAQRGDIARDIHSLVPGLPPYIARESVHMDIFTEDKRPVIGHVSSRVIVGTGFSGHGFKLTPAFGNALASFALGNAPAHDLSLFSPTRFAA